MKRIGLLGVGLCLALRLTAAEPPVWIVAPEASQVDFAVHATVDSFVGHLIKFDANFFSNGAAQATGGSLTFQVSDLKTGKDDRDEQMLSWLEAKKFPVATFVLKTLIPAGDKFEATGDLTLHGITRSIHFLVTLGLTGNRSTIDGSATIDHREWDLKIIRKMGLLKVDPVIKITFHFESAAP